MGKRFWLTVLAVWFTTLLLEFTIHAVVLGRSVYATRPDLFLGERLLRDYPLLQRTAIFIAQIVWAIFFTTLYQRGVEGREGARNGMHFGFLIWGVAMLPYNLGMYSWSLFPGRLLACWIAFGMVEGVLIGLVCALVYGRGSVK